MLWIAAYCAVTPLSAMDVLQQIALSVGLDAGALAGIAGVAIHLGLSMLLGLAFAVAVWRPFFSRRARIPGVLAACGILAVIWASNFLLVLPVLNPHFATLMPVWVTLFSKLLFGAALGFVLTRSAYARQRSDAAQLCREVRLPHRAASA